tara:strand:- start:339 stop:644 length:306 start_codon:yes stop_codon:yes gene_type:complete
MKSLKLFVFLTCLVCNNTFANNIFADSLEDCNQYLLNIKSMIQKINIQKKECESFGEKRKNMCYLNLELKYNALSRAIFYTETVCEPETLLTIKSLKKDLL